MTRLLRNVIETIRDWVADHSQLIILIWVIGYAMTLYLPTQTLGMILLIPWVFAFLIRPREDEIVMWVLWDVVGALLVLIFVLYFMSL